MRGEWLSLRILPNESEQTRFGCAIRKKVAPQAVQRNRLKRWLRESFRLHPEAVPKGLNLVVMVQKVPAGVDFYSTEREFLTLCRRLAPMG